MHIYIYINTYIYIYIYIYTYCSFETPPTLPTTITAHTHSCTMPKTTV